MTNTEFKKKITEATDLEWFNDLEETFSFPYLNTIQKLKGITSIYEYVNQQISGWEKIENPPKEFKASMAYFVNIKNHILAFVNSYMNQPVKP